MKYIVVTGGVMSGLGKGITTASIGRILKNRGYEVTAVKIDPYLNIDAGTMNPAQHGEVFVLSDGAEVDLDLGNYERFLDINLKSIHNITTGKVYRSVIEKERRGDYLGATVQIIPHITDEIRHCIRRAAQEEVNGGRTAEICLVEVGGTVGDIESMPFLEAVRQMHAELAPQDMVLVHVTLVPADAMGNLKTKPTQHSVKALRELGLQPDIIVGRSSEMIGPQTKKKISAFTDVPVKAVISAKDVPDIYQIPMELEKEGLAEVICDYLAIENREPDTEWYRIVSREYTNRVTVAIISKYGIEDVYMSIKEALKHAGRALSTEVNIRWLDAEMFDLRDLADVDGILVPGGFGKRGVEGKIRAIRYARENKKPYLGLCLGFQLSVVEYARHVLGIPDATSEEVGPGTHVIALLPEQEGISNLGGTMRLGNCTVTLKEGTMVADLYGTTMTVERHRHRYEVNPDFISDLEDGGLIFTGTCGSRMEVCELPDHPFYLATQFHPEFKSSPTNPSPPYIGFVSACKKNKASTRAR
ncbi:MAG TPA: CTP synthase [Candidatus Methanoculleus thermohydrogenotrophicum]|nr:CTP synthase [Candidatus Methanoculleus thermohydrogenotrophicum]NLM82248.1 CTP synthase [Candidatus Methanoculleus thermohydrogenotrophicum]HOB17993.1 CTP synthase [Candidatus Methanoculleus thermohydrogenotrophicum]HPZ38223.1 CTP synthase [Candidatus Methanoculleus thermohydrogenotrophicum]HQC91350.1 CTP synthase [Candidatus Methanoculleus thermohydrogenotrophicum]